MKCTGSQNDWCTDTYIYICYFTSVSLYPGWDSNPCSWCYMIDAQTYLIQDDIINHNCMCLVTNLWLDLIANSDQIGAMKHFFFDRQWLSRFHIKAQRRLWCCSSEKVMLAGPKTWKTFDFNMFLSNDDMKQFCQPQMKVGSSIQGTSRLEEANKTVWLWWNTKLIIFQHLMAKL